MKSEHRTVTCQTLLAACLDIGVQLSWIFELYHNLIENAFNRSKRRLWLLPRGCRGVVSAPAVGAYLTRFESSQGVSRAVQQLHSSPRKSS